MHLYRRLTIVGAPASKARSPFVYTTRRLEISVEIDLVAAGVELDELGAVLLVFGADLDSLPHQHLLVNRTAGERGAFDPRRSRNQSERSCSSRC